MADTQYRVRVPNAQNRETVRQRLVEDEDFRITKIKLGGDDPPKFTIPTPTDDDPDNQILAKGFVAVILAARPNFFKDKNKPEEEPKERRALYLVRAGKVIAETGKVDGATGSYYPDLLYAAPSSLREWKSFCAIMSPKCPNIKNPVVPKGTPYQHVLVHITGKRVKTDQYTWNKLEFTPIRLLDEKEIGWITELIPMVEGKIAVYESNENLDAAEDDVVYGGSKSVDTVDPETAHSTRAIAATPSGDEEDAAPNADAAAKKAEAAAKKKAEKEAAEAEAKAKAEAEAAAKAKAAAASSDDDDDDSGTPPTATTKPSTQQTTTADDDAAEEAPKPARRSVSMPDDDD